MDEPKADQLLRLLVGLVVTAGLVCVGVAGWRAATHPPASLAFPLVVAGLVLVASFCLVRFDARAQYVITLTSASVLIAVALLPTAWAVLCVALGVGVAKPFVNDARKAAFNTARTCSRRPRPRRRSTRSAHYRHGGQPTFTTWWQYLLAAGRGGRLHRGRPTGRHPGDRAGQPYPVAARAAAGHGVLRADPARRPELGRAGGAVVHGRAAAGGRHPHGGAAQLSRQSAPAAPSGRAARLATARRLHRRLEQCRGSGDPAHRHPRRRRPVPRGGDRGRARRPRPSPTGPR